MSNLPRFSKGMVHRFAILALMLAIWPRASYGFAAQTSPVCNSSGPASGAYTVTLCLTAPSAGAVLVGASQVTVTLSVTGTNPGVRRMVFNLNNGYLLTDYQSPYTFSLPTQKYADGTVPLKVQAVMRDGFTTQFTSQDVTFANGNASAPVNGNSFTPSTGRPVGPGEQFVVAAAGDAASGEVNAGRVSDLVQSWNPNLFLYLGDVYEKGTITEFFNWYGLPDTYFGRYRAITNPTIGNHEYEFGLAPGYFDYWDNVPNYYSYDAGGWHFISLNSNSAFVGVTAGSPQYQWLEADLQASAAMCTIVYYHHPLFNVGEEPPKTEMSDVWALLANYGVEIVLNGHDHDYQRWVPLDRNGQPDGLGVTEFVVGGGGHGYQQITLSDSRLAASAGTYPNAMGALRLVLNPNGASYGYYNLLGTLVDSGTIGCHGSDVDHQPPSTPENVTAQANSHVQATVNWSASSDNVGVQGYDILRDGVNIASVSSGVYSYVDRQLQPATTYSYSVMAYDAAVNHSTPSTPVSVTTFPLPPSLTFNPTADTYVNASSPNSNYGTATSLRLDASPDLHAYLRFTVTGLAGMTPARVRLLVYSNNNSPVGISAYQVGDNAWDERTMKYGNAPPLGALISSSGKMTSGTWVTLDLTAVIRTEGTYSLAISTASLTALNLSSREAGTLAPQLIVDF